MRPPPCFGKFAVGVVLSVLRRNGYGHRQTLEAAGGSRFFERLRIRRGQKTNPYKEIV